MMNHQACWRRNITRLLTCSRPHLWQRRPSPTICCAHTHGESHHHHISGNTVVLLYVCQGNPISVCHLPVRAQADKSTWPTLGGSFVSHCYYYNLYDWLIDWLINFFDWTISNQWPLKSHTELTSEIVNCIIMYYIPWEFTGIQLVL